MDRTFQLTLLNRIICSVSGSETIACSSRENEGRIDASWLHLSPPYGNIKHYIQYMYTVKVLQYCICSINEERENKDIKETFFNPHSHRRVLNGLNQNTCRKMGMNYKAALIPQGIRETIHGWRRHGTFADDSTIHRDTSTILSVEEDDDQLVDRPRVVPRTGTEIELQPYIVDISGHSIVANETSSKIGTPLLRPIASISSTVSPRIQPEVITRSLTMPTRRE